MRTPCLAFFCILLASTARASGPDKAKLLEHLRESYNIPPALEVSLGDFKPSEVPGLDAAEITLTKGAFRQTDKLYVSRDGKHYLLGGFRDLSANPDQERLAKMDLKSSPSRGTDKAKVVVVQYTDFQCPYCQMGFQLMRDKIMKEYPKDVRWVYKALPLAQIHPWAEPAALAAACAAEQGQDKFWALHDRLFEGQRGITPATFEEKLKALAAESKLKEKLFLACYDGKKTQAGIDRDVAESEALGLTSTPSFLVNGHLISGGADYASIKQTIEEALKGKHGKL